MSEREYIGKELELFATAKNWKSYVREQVEPYLTGDVLEVGAGLGGTTRVLAPGGSTSWTCLEPDSTLAAQLRRAIHADEIAADCRVRIGTLDDLEVAERFETILYMDVLEHIEDDAAEVRRAVSRLRPNGTLVVLGPAHEWLFTPFDEALGHFRRYDRRMLVALTPPDARLERFRYLDMVGIIASTGNRLFLRQSVPSPGHLKIWDQIMVPMSRRLDPLVGYRFGKSALAVWRKPAA